MKISLLRLLTLALLLVTVLSQDSAETETAETVETTQATPAPSFDMASCDCWTEIGGVKYCADDDENLVKLCSLPTITYLSGILITVVFVVLASVDKWKYKHKATIAEPAAE